jgi:hypothetical protein
MDLLNAFLDCVNAIATAVAVVGFWYTWVVPPNPRRLPPDGGASAPAELEQFLRAVALRQNNRLKPAPLEP